MPLRRLVAAVASGAALLAGLLSGMATAPAQALPPTTRTFTDASEKTAAYDITQVTLRSAPRSDRPAIVLVKYARKVKTGDAVQAWFDLDGDKVPDLHVSGDAFSEFTVHKAKSFTKDGKDISDQDCVRLAMAGSASKFRLFPECVGSPLSFSVSVKSSVQGKPASTDDWAPATQKFSKQVLAAPLS